MHKRTLFLLFMGISLGIIGQEKKPNFMVRYVNKFTRDTTAKEKPQNLFCPSINYAPETKLGFGAANVVVGFAKRDTNNRLSEIRAFGFATLLKQYGLLIDQAIFSNKNRWFFLGLLKIQSFPLAYHGIGYKSPKNKIALIEGFTFNFRERFLRNVWGPFYLGLELDFQHLSRVSFQSFTNNTALLNPLGKNGSNNLGVGLGFLYDTRHNVLNVRKGVFFETAVLNYRKSLGSINNFSSLFTDFRYFFPLRNRNVLAFQYAGQFTFGDAPFNQYSLLGGEMIMRGYYLGRYRDKNSLSIQTEYRMLPLKFSKKFGLAVFAGLGGVYNKVESITVRHLKYAGGVGLHYLLFPKKDVWARLDYALNNELGRGIYLTLGCAF